MLFNYVTWAVLATSANLARAQINAIDETNDGDYDRIDIRTWNEAMASPNATVSLDTFGYDVSRAFPGNKSDGWTLSLSVVGDIDYQSRRFTGAMYSYEPPARMRNSSEHDSWVSGTYIRAIDFDNTADVPSDCSGVLSEECLSDLRSSAEGGDSGSAGLPESCEDEIGDSDNLMLARGGWPVANQTSTFQVVLHEPGETKFYDDLVSKAHIFFLEFMEHNDDEAGDGGERLESVLLCMRPDEFSDGSRGLDEIDDSATSSQPANALILFLSVVAALAILG